MLVATLSQIFFWVFVTTNVIFFALFFWKIYASYRAAESKTAVVVKAIVSFTIWLVTTFIILVGSTGYFAGHTLESAEPRMVHLESATFYLISFIIGWILVGAAILYWMSRLPKPKNYGSN